MEKKKKRLMSLGLASLMLTASGHILPTLASARQVETQEEEEDYDEDYDDEDENDGDNGQADAGNQEAPGVAYASDVLAMRGEEEIPTNRRNVDEKEEERRTKVQAAIIALNRSLDSPDPYNTYQNVRYDRETGKKIVIEPITNCEADYNQHRATFSGKKLYIGPNQVTQREEHNKQLNEMYTKPGGPHGLSFFARSIEVLPDGTKKEKVIGEITVSSARAKPKSESQDQISDSDVVAGELGKNGLPGLRSGVPSMQLPNMDNGGSFQKQKLLPQLPLKSGEVATMTCCFELDTPASCMETSVGLTLTYLKSLHDTDSIKLDKLEIHVPAGESSEFPFLTTYFKKVPGAVKFVGQKMFFTHVYDLGESTHDGVYVDNSKGVEGRDRN